MRTLALALALLLTTPAPVFAESPAEETRPREEIRTEELLIDAEVALGQRDLAAAAAAFTAAAEVSTDVAVAERATQFTFGAGFDGYAERAVGRWVALAPEYPLPRELLGRLKLRRHDVDAAAIDLLAALGPGEPRRDEVYQALAADLSAEDDANAVTRVLARLTALDPLAPGLQLALGTAALRSGDYALALGAAETAGQDDPDWVEPRLLAARALAGAGREEEALAQAAALAGEPGGPASKPAPGETPKPAPGEAPAPVETPNPLIELEYARLLADTGKVVEARQRLLALVTRFGNRPEITRTLAFLDLAAGDLDAADQRFDALDNEGADRFESFYYRGQIAALRGDPEGARRYFGRISSGPYLVPGQLAIAESLVREGQGEAAVEHLTAFGFDHPAQAYDVLESKAQVLQLLKRPADALEVYAEALRYKPSATSVLLSRGALLEQEGRVSDALDDLGRAAELAPGDAAVVNAYGYILANRTRQASRAWRYVRRAYEIQPGSAAIQDSVGWTLFKLGRTAEARSHLEEALDRMPDPEIASHLADVYWKLGEREEATELLLSAAAAFPDSKPVRETAGRLLN